MMRCTNLFTYSTPSGASLIKPSTAHFRNVAMRYSNISKDEECTVSSAAAVFHGGEGEEKAHSTAEEFQRVAEEKEKLKRVVKQKEQQGVASQTIERAHDATVEATLGDSKVESVKERYKQTAPNENYHKT